MGNPSNFEGGNNEGIFEHFRSSIPRGAGAGIIRNVINGSCFSIERFFISQAAGKTKLTLYDKDTRHQTR
jgi:biopolymer transport protein ExbB